MAVVQSFRKVFGPARVRLDSTEGSKILQVVFGLWIRSGYQRKVSTIRVNATVMWAARVCVILIQRVF